MPCLRRCTFMSRHRAEAMVYGATFRSRLRLVTPTSTGHQRATMKGNPGVGHSYPKIGQSKYRSMFDFLPRSDLQELMGSI